MSITGKIYRRITDFLGNKIINVKTDSPVNDEDIVNKKYVDDNNLYNTEKSKKDSPKFPWFKSQYNRTMKEVLDELLYKTEQLWTEPKLEFVNFQLKDNLSGNNENIINSGNLQKFYIEIEIGYTNRETNVNPKLVFLRNNGNRDVIELEHNTRNNYYFKTFDIDFLSVKDVLIERVYESISNQDAPDEFKVPLNFSKSIFSFIKKNFLIYEPIYYLSIPEDDLTEIADKPLTEQLSLIEGYVVPKLSLFERGNKINLVKNNINKYFFILLANNIIESNLEFFIKDKLTGHILSRDNYSYNDFQIKAYKTVQELAPFMGNQQNLIYTDISKVSSFIFVYCEFGDVIENSELYITYDKIYYTN